MKRSEVNQIIKKAEALFEKYCWKLPPDPRWDVTDFGLGNFEKSGLVLINLAEEPEYCEKLMTAGKGQITPLHTHKKKKEDIIVRWGQLALELWDGLPEAKPAGHTFTTQINGKQINLKHGEIVHLNAGERITLTPGIYHAFWPTTDACIIGEVSTANDDQNDNFFIDPNIGRFSSMDEDEAPYKTLVSDGKN